MKKIICRMGENYAFIKPNGEVERCCKNHSIKLGNIVKGTFRLLEKARECDTEETCSCWRRMDISKTMEWEKHWKGCWDKLYTKQIESMLQEKSIEEIRKNLQNLYLLLENIEIKNTFYFLKGRINIKLGNYETAKELIEKAIEIDSMNVDNYILLSSINIELKDYEEAKQAVEKAEYLVKESNDNRKSEILFLNGRISRDLGNYETAKELIEKAIEIDSMNVDNYILLSSINIELKDYEEAKQVVEKAEYLVKESDKYRKEKIFLLYGKIYRKIGNYEEANKKVEQAIKINSNNIQSYILLSNICFELKDYKKAKEIVKKAEYLVKGNDNEIEKEIFLLDVRINIELEKYEEAKEAIEKVIKIDLTNTDNYILLSDINIKLEKYEEAKEAVKKAKSLVNENDNERNKEIFSLESRIDIKCGNYETAKELIEKVIEIDPMNVDNYILLSDINVGLKDYGKAKEAEEKAESLVKENDNNRRKKIFSLKKNINIKLGNYEVVKQAIEELIRINSENTDDYALLINMYFDLEKYQEAENILKKININNNYDLLISYGILKIILYQDYEKAREMIEKAIYVDNRKMKGYVILGRIILEMKNDFKETILFFDKALSLCNTKDEFLDTLYIILKELKNSLYSKQVKKESIDSIKKWFYNINKIEFDKFNLWNEYIKDEY